MAIATVVAAVCAFGSIYIAWNTQRRAAEAEIRTANAEKLAQEAANQANEFREKSNQTSSSALDEAQRANETANRALEEARNANLHREELLRLERARQDLRNEDRLRELSANLRCIPGPVMHSGDKATCTFKIVNIGPALAENVIIVVKLHDLAFSASGTGHPRSLKTNQHTTIEWSPRLDPYRSSIESDIYHIIATYVDGAGIDGHQQEWCFRFTGAGTEEGVGYPALETIDCDVV